MSKAQIVGCLLGLSVLLSGCLSPGEFSTGGAAAGSTEAAQTARHSPSDNEETGNNNPGEVERDDGQPDNSGSDNGERDNGDSATPEPPAEADTASVDAFPPDEENQPQPQPQPVNPSGIPLFQQMVPTPGVRAFYRLVAEESTLDLSAPESVALVLQPSRTSAVNLSVHGPGAESYLIMEEDQSRWTAVPDPDATSESALLAAQSDPVISDERFAADALFSLPWPAFLPAETPGFLLDLPSPSDDAVVTPAGEGTWHIDYRLDGIEVRVSMEHVRAAPSDLETLLPVTYWLITSEGELVYRLSSAAVYRERTVSGVVVSPQGRPQEGVTVALHPRVGQLPPTHRAITGTFGTFELSYRAAPGDSIRIYYGEVEGQGEDARIAAPAELVGRVGTPDFATLIYPAPVP
jgi:hypothetical protein